MCMNVARQRRRHRRAVEDWAALHAVACTADACAALKWWPRAAAWDAKPVGGQARHSPILLPITVDIPQGMLTTGKVLLSRL